MLCAILWVVVRWKYTDRSGMNYSLCVTCTSTACACFVPQGPGQSFSCPFHYLAPDRYSFPCQLDPCPAVCMACGHCCLLVAVPSASRRVYLLCKQGHWPVAQAALHSWKSLNKLSIAEQGNGRACMSCPSWLPSLEDLGFGCTTNSVVWPTLRMRHAHASGYDSC